MNDRYESWRQNNSIGYVMLAFAVIISAINDLFYGETPDMIDAANFWSGGELLDEELYGYWSSRDLWLAVIGMNRIPDIVDDFIQERKSLDDPDFAEEVLEYLKTLKHHYELIKIDYYYTHLNE